MNVFQIIVTLIVGVSAPVGIYLGVRYTTRQGRAANDDRSSATWERKYRAGAERHLRWDADLLGLVRDMRSALLELLPHDHHLRTELEKPIPDAPSLFPDTNETGD